MIIIWITFSGSFNVPCLWIWMTSYWEDFFSWNSIIRIIRNVWMCLGDVSDHIDGLAWDCSSSIADALEILQPCSKPPILWPFYFYLPSLEIHLFSVFGWAFHRFVAILLVRFLTNPGRITPALISWFQQLCALPRRLTDHSVLRWQRGCVCFREEPTHLYYLQLIHV